MVSTERYRERNTQRDRANKRDTKRKRNKETQIHNYWEEISKFPSSTWWSSILIVVFWLLNTFLRFTHNISYQKPIVIKQWYFPLVKRSQRFAKGKEGMKCELEKGVF